ncbi:MAG: (Na+)-NQR maturation NqrM [Oceanococcaceae bacterium]
MIATIAITFVVMFSAVMAMAIGALVANKPIKGSCGGIAAQDGYNCACAAAGQKMCDDESPANKRGSQSKLALDALKNAPGR